MSYPYGTMCDVYGQNPYSPRALRQYFLRQMEQLVATVQELTDAVARVSADVDALVAFGAEKIAPAALDPIATALADVSAKLEAAVAPPA